MTRRPPGTLQVLRLLAWTAFTRYRRGATKKRSERSRGRTRREDKAGQGTPLLVLMFLMVPALVIQSFTMSNRAVQGLASAATKGEHMLVVRPFVMYILQEHVPDAANDVDLRKKLADNLPGSNSPTHEEVFNHYKRWGLDGFRQARARPSFLLAQPVDWSDEEAKNTFIGGGALLVLVLAFMVFATGLSVGNANLRGGSTFGWLMTFPVRTHSLLTAKALEYTLLQPFAWLTIFVLLLQLLLALSQPYAVWLAAVSTLATCALVGCTRLWLETWLRLRWSLRTMRTVQAAGSIAGLLALALVAAACFGEATPGWFVDLAAALPTWASSLPTAWPLAWANGNGWVVVPALGATACLIAALLRTTERHLQAGTMQSGGVDARGRGTENGRAPLERPLGIMRKDLLMLQRDRNFFVQTLVVPSLFIGMQMILNPGMRVVAESTVALMAYGIGTYAVMAGGFQVLGAEGRALWMLYALPHTLGSMLRTKAQLWATVAVGFSLLALLIAALPLRSAAEIGPLILDGAFVGAGTWCVAHIAAAISILGTRPEADHVPREPKGRYVYLFFVLAGTYAFSLRSSDLAIRIPGLLVFATLSLSIWQRACDRLPWLLDPRSELRRDIGLYDGAVALVWFFILQAVIVLIAIASTLGFNLTHVFFAFSLAGAISLTVSWFLMSMRGVDVPLALGLVRPAGEGRGRAMLKGATLGLAAGAIGIAYIHLMREIDAFEFTPHPPTQAGHLVLVLLAVVAAPIVEECLFRGMIFSGLRRAFPFPAALLWSTALFAAVHPMQSWLPVFLMGAAAAWIFHRSRYLPAAMATHAIYNLIVVVFAP